MSRIDPFELDGDAFGLSLVQISPNDFSVRDSNEKKSIEIVWNRFDWNDSTTFPPSNLTPILVQFKENNFCSHAVVTFYYDGPHDDSYFDFRHRAEFVAKDDGIEIKCWAILPKCPKW